MPPRIKRESVAAPSMSTRSVLRSEQDPAMPTPERTVPPSDVMTDRRGARSGAPSVDTRPAVPTLAPTESSVGDNDDIVLLEIKSKPIKSEPDDTSSTAHNDSFIGPNMALKDFGQELRATNDALSEIQVRGISHVASLPELVLVGDQSSGKSSLMSAIAGLSLPRSSGACTRCPLHIRISRADEWSCRVFIKQDYEFRQPGHPITINHVTQSNKFPPWRPLPIHEQARHEFKTVRDRFDSEELETVLHCAQVAILNPTTSYTFFIPKLKGEAPEATRKQHAERVKEKSDQSEAQFSPNTVALEVKGPDLADLNFYDLPGVFITAKRPEDRFLEKVVKNLACDYISRPNAIILWAVPMNQDAENSYAFKLIRDLKAEDRCVGVMTKADLLPQDLEASTNWLAMLDERAHHTGLGYFITSRQEGDLESQNKREEAFFNRTPAFPGDDPSWPEVFEPFRDRCGVEKLKAFLSLKLGEEFSKVLPEVKLKVNNRLEDLKTQLKKYPNPPPNPEMEIMRSLSNFSTRVKDRLRQQDFMSLWDCRAAEPFKHAILQLKPRFNVSEPSAAATKQIVTIDLSVDSPPTTSRKRAIPGPVPVTPSKRPRGDVVPGSGSTIKLEESTPHSTMTCTIPRSGSTVPFPLQTPGRASRSKDLATIRAIIKRNAIPGQPGLVSGSVYEPLYTESARLWGDHLEIYIARTFQLVEAEIMHIVESAFETLKSRAVYKESVLHLQAFINKHSHEMRQQLMLLYNLESRRLFTKDDDSLERNKANEKRILDRHRHYCRMAARNGTEVGRIPKWEDLTEDDLAKEAIAIAKDAKTLGPDPYDQEVNVAAYVRGYYLTAASRFIDLVCIHFMSGLLPEIANRIDTYLDDRLGLAPGGAAKEVLDRLVDEGDENARKRNELRAEEKRLMEALQIIVDLENSQRTTPRPSNGYSRHGSASLISGNRTSHRSVAASVTQNGEA